MVTEYLKDGNKMALKTLAVVNVAIFWGVVVSHADLSTIPALFASISRKDGLIALLAPIATFTLNGLLSADTKARLIYWRYHHPLPGSRAFTHHLPVDGRADPSTLIDRWGDLPNDPDDQNRLWYRIYKQVESDIRVHEAHRAWLLSRDMTGYAALFFPFLAIPTLLMDTPWASTGWYLLWLLTQYVFGVAAARTYGDRFVQNVLAVASSTQSDQATGTNNTI